MPRYDNIQYADGTKEKSSPVTVNASTAPEKGTEFVDAPSDTKEAKSDELIIEEQRDEQGYKEGERKKGVLRKLHLHKVV